MQTNKPNKSKLGKITKLIREEINTELRTTLDLPQKKKTRSVIDWLPNINHIPNWAFVQHDIIDFDPFITEYILYKSISLTKEYKKDIVLHRDDGLIILKNCNKQNKIKLEKKLLNNSKGHDSKLIL